MSKVAVLGCGPAGLMAAHACHLSQVNFDILSMPKQSRIGGAQYLHQWIPGLTAKEPDGEIEFVKIGNRNKYALRVYNDPGHQTSWDEFPAGTYAVWNLQKCYNDLWERYSDKIIPIELDWQGVDKIVDSYQLVISAIPLPALVPPELFHFAAQAVFISDTTRASDMQIVYNGGPLHSWYRTSKIFGFGSTEWSEPPLDEDTIRIKKPLGTDCDAWPNILKVGRYGKWKKGELVNHAFNDALLALGSLVEP